MDEFKLKKEELEEIIRKAFIHGQGNGQMMEAGLERDEVDDYTLLNMIKLTRKEHLKNLTKMGDYSTDK